MHHLMWIIVKEDTVEDALESARGVFEEHFMGEVGAMFDSMANMEEEHVSFGCSRFTFYENKRGAFKLDTKQGQEELARSWKLTKDDRKKHWDTIREKTKDMDSDDFIRENNYQLLSIMNRISYTHHTSQTVRLYDNIEFFKPVLSIERFHKILERDLSKQMIVPLDCHS